MAVWSRLFATSGPGRQRQGYPKWRAAKRTSYTDHGRHPSFPFRIKEEWLNEGAVMPVEACHTFKQSLHGRPATIPLSLLRAKIMRDTGKTILMIYGAYGYTGQLIVTEAMTSGLRPVLAGRDQKKLVPVAHQWGLELRTVALNDAGGLLSALEDVDVVLHCAGPFSRTAESMVAACLKTGNALSGHHGGSRCP